MLGIVLWFLVIAGILGWVTFLIHKLVDITWLHNIIKWLVIALPFERIPSLSLGNSNIRISQILTLAGVYLTIVLIFKKDQRVLKTKLNSTFYLGLAFFALSLPAMFFVKEFDRYFITEIGTVVCFMAAILISHFGNNLTQRIKELMISLVGVSIFGVYQFFGDLAGLPITLTGLREQYTKIVFGFPRIQGTAIEPLYFAGMLFVPIFLILSKFLLEKNTFNAKLKNILLALFLIIVFVLTLSKGAWLAFIIGFVLFGIMQRRAIWRISKNLRITQIFQVATLLALILVLGYFLSPQFQTGINTTIEHLQTTISGEATTIVERDRFVEKALDLIPGNALTGLGSGQYGTYFSQGADGGYLIVNNVYLEVWLEHGLLASIAFIVFLTLPLYRIYTSKQYLENWVISGLFFGLITYYLQWFTFSPVFIMPIFILIGLANMKLEVSD